MLDSHFSEGNDCVLLKPLQGFPVIRDLQIDWNPAGQRMKQVIPHHEPLQNGEINTTGGMNTELYNSFMKLGSCITCGLCVSGCPVIPGGEFIEPFIFIKCQKIMEDTRVDTEFKKLMISNLHPHLMLCLNCGKCSDVCPRGLSPEEAVNYLRESVG
jgi:succinate dehydrogenase / fumarate reductase iron-sulfur subunit